MEPELSSGWELPTPNKRPRCLGCARCHPALGGVHRVAAPTPSPASHLVVFGDGLVAAVHGPEILHFIPQGGLHVLQLGLRGGDAFRTLASLRPRVSDAEKQEPQPQQDAVKQDPRSAQPLFSPSCSRSHPALPTRTSGPCAGGRLLHGKSSTPFFYY